MIQRVQTIFLFLSAIALSLYFFFPLAAFLPAPGELYYLHVLGLAESGVQACLMAPLNTLPMLILPGIIILISLVTIFLFKKRVLQMRLCVYNILLMIGMLGMQAFYIYQVWKFLDTPVLFRFPVLLPVVSVIFTILAYRNIREDELLIRSVDRIR